LQPFSLLYQALDAGVDTMPPAYHMVVRLARVFSSDAQLALRLPSIAGYLLTLLGTYWFARKRLPAIAGLTAVLLVAVSPFRAWAVEARSYALLTGLLAIAAAAWQRIGERRLFTLLYGVFLTLAVSCHHLALVAIGPFGIAELARVLEARRIRWSVWAAKLAAVVPFLASLPILLHLRTVFGKNFWAKPGWSGAVSTYRLYFGLQWEFLLPLILFLGLLAVDAVTRAWRNSSGSDERPRAYELVLLAGLLFYPALLVVLTKIMGTGYTERYGWPAILGFALGAVYLFRVYELPFVHLAVALLLALPLLQSRAASKVAWKKEDARWTRLQHASHEEPGIPVVIGSGQTYLEAVQYAPADLHDRMMEVVDVDTATRLTGRDTVDRNNSLLARYVPLHVEDLARFEGASGKFLLYSGGPLEWLSGYLTQKGYHLRLLSSEVSGDQIYQIYLVSR
jgi:hypothetical protein